MGNFAWSISIYPGACLSWVLPAHRVFYPILTLNAFQGLFTVGQRPPWLMTGFLQSWRAHDILCFTDEKPGIQKTSLPFQIPLPSYKSAVRSTMPITQCSFSPRSSDFLGNWQHRLLFQINVSRLYPFMRSLKHVKAKMFTCLLVRKKYFLLVRKITH